ncbi:MAG: WbqC family protein [Oscillospiraceae bacterium]|nr:WbqC family protein [Oscillospiraceae bacterium]
MIAAANQPYFLPYIAYWQLIHASDLFLIGDDYAYIKRGWINRNRILFNGAPEYFGVEVQKASSFRLCSELRRAEIDKRKKMNKIYEAYHNAPYYEAGRELIDGILSCEEEVLSEYLLFSIREICAYLGITTPIMKTSEIEGNSLLKREQRIFDFCEKLGADVYANPIGGMALYSFEDFRRHGISLRFIRTGEIAYRQYGGAFVDKLSILDVIMFNSPEEIRTMLDQYVWVTEDGILQKEEAFGGCHER